MSDTNFWKPVYQLFKPDQPLATPEELRNFYIQRANSPVKELVSFLEMEETPVQFLLAGHRGSGKTTELRKIEQELKDEYLVLWIDTETPLDRFNIGYAEVVVLIGYEIYQRAIKHSWFSRKAKLIKDLENSLKTIALADKRTSDEKLGTSEWLEKLGVMLKHGLTREVTKTLNISPSLSEMLDRVNTIIEAAEKERNQKLLVIVDGLDRHEYSVALSMFSSRLLTDLGCHIIYTIPISLRYSPYFVQAREFFQCLDLTNPPVFLCDQNGCPTPTRDDAGRRVLASVIKARLSSLGQDYESLFHPPALDLLCEKSGGVMRDLIRLAQYACQKAKGKGIRVVDLETAQDALIKGRSDSTIHDYHYPELARIHRTGKLSTTPIPNRQDMTICDELLHNKLALAYEDSKGRWYDVHPILIDDLNRWEAANP